MANAIALQYRLPRKIVAHPLRNISRVSLLLISVINNLFKNTQFFNRVFNLLFTR